MLESVFFMISLLKYNKMKFDELCREVYASALKSLGNALNQSNSWYSKQYLSLGFDECTKLLGKSEYKDITFDELLTVYFKQLADDFAAYLEAQVRVLSDDDFMRVTQSFTDMRNGFVGLWKESQDNYLKYYKTVDFKGEEPLKGSIFVRSVKELSKAYLEEHSSEGIISLSYTSTENPYWYCQDSRSILLAYDVCDKNYTKLIGMSTEDCTSYTNVFINREQSKELAEYVFYKILLDGFLPAGAILNIHYYNFQPAYYPEELKQDNEVILTSNAEAEAIIITENYFEEFDKGDTAGVKAYSKYCNIPVYKLINGELTKI